MPQPCEQQENIVAMKDILSTHNGQWKVLLWGMGLFAGIMITFATAMYSSQTKATEVANAINQTLHSYISSTNIRNTHLELLIEQEAKRIDDHESRIRTLEKPTNYGGR